MAEIYTPGHGIVTDSLIMHGIVKLYDVRKVERVGERFKLMGSFETPDSGTLSLLEEELRIYSKHPEVLSSSSVLGKVTDSNVNVSVTPKWLGKLSDALTEMEGDITDVYTVDHKDKLKEGRKGKQEYLLYLPLSFVYGKFSQSDYSVTAKDYSVCGHCFALSNIGLIYGTAVVRYSGKDKTSVTLMTIIPDEEMDRADLLLAQRFVQGKSVSLYTELTLKSVVLYVLSVGETLFSFGEHSPQVLVWRLERSGNFMRSLQPMALRLGGVLKKVAEIKADYPYFTNIVLKLSRSEDGAVVLDRLADIILFNGDPYPALRQLSLFLRKNKDEVGELTVKDLPNFAKILTKQ
ncbi:hypothetical protein [Stygiolobus caldivivus]|uniref:Uncharacterized protein n=1 Tax=Stygiolobus caldivivus TaxID=2824673 RepID=A0A8D5U5N9_9CREN|nr:hypothetical protein [Stygiolobus caldivivus]BCU69769.1 hypothetical protein KN1_10660 [Stygiolobus caldivivus]